MSLRAASHTVIGYIENQQFVSVFIQIFLVSSVTRFYFGKGRFGRSRSSKVNKFGANRKRVCDFLLVRNSNFGPILHRFGATNVLCAPDPTPIQP